MIEAGELPGVKLGRAVRIPLEALEQWIADKEAEAEESRSAYGSKARLG
jgi:predicted DNA-binding transcriptional regulator AlpA